MDLSGDPTKGDFNTFKGLFTLARDSGLNLALHCGEVENDSEVLEMLEFGMDRIGHGTFISESNEHIWKLHLQKQIPIECCLSSNVKCSTVKSVKDHHFAKYFQLGYPVVICVRVATSYVVIFCTKM